MRRVLAIDQGTTSTRGIVFATGEAPRMVASLRHRQDLPRPGWVEQDARELLANVRRCIGAAGPVEAIGLANQGESCLAWDARTGEPFTPVLTWQDARTVEVIARMKRDGVEDFVRCRTGLPLDSYFSASKLGWIVREFPAARAALAAGRLRLGTTDAFFLEHLTGRYATDPSTAARTSLMDLATLAWDAELCRLFDVPIEALPPIQPTCGAFGEIGGVPITASVVDQPAALRGHGALAPGEAKITFGTGAFVLVQAGPAVPRDAPDGLIRTVAWSTSESVAYAVEGGVYDAGAVLEWARRIGLVGDWSELAALGDPSAIARGVTFVPALSGLAAPQWDRSRRASWAGLGAETTREDMQKAMLEGIALQTCEVLSLIERRVRLAPAISVDGGLTANDYFVQFLADVSGQRISRGGDHDLTARGCAILAGWSSDRPSAPRRFDPTIDPTERHMLMARYNARLWDQPGDGPALSPAA